MSIADAWREHLTVSANKIPKPWFNNAVTALREAPAWQGCLAFDEFTQQAILTDSPPWGQDLQWESRFWTTQDDRLLTKWLQDQDIGVNIQTAAQAVEAVARDVSVHSVQQYLGGLQHDGRARIQTWLSTYLGCEQTPYHKSVGKAMLIAAVARIWQPGCKVDTVPILEGAQGARKSTAVRALFEPWFTDELADLGSKDASLQIRGVWGVEVSELDAMSRGEVSKIKAFISRTTDRFRPPYGARVEERARECVFWGTTNSDSYLKDETGGRRFWPIKVGKINIDKLVEDRDQLWAEAQIAYGANAPWWLTKDEIQKAAEQQQRDRYIGDPWDDLIADYVSKEPAVSIAEVLRGALGMEIARCGQIEQNRVARCLKSLGLSRVQVRIGGDKRVWKYRKPMTSPHEFPGDRPATSTNTSDSRHAGDSKTPYGAATSPLSPLEHEHEKYW